MRRPEVFATIFMVLITSVLGFAHSGEAAATVPTQAIAGGAELCSGIGAGGQRNSCSIAGVLDKQIHIANLVITGTVGPTYTGGCANVSVAGLAAGTLYFGGVSSPATATISSLFPSRSRFLQRCREA